MYRYQTDAPARDGQRWPDFEPQLFAAAVDDQRVSAANLYSSARQPDVSLGRDISLQSQLLGPHFTNNHLQTLPLPDHWHFSSTPASRLSAPPSSHNSNFTATRPSTARHRPDLACQQFTGSQQPSFEPKWHSPSSSRILAHHQPLCPEQQSKQDYDIMRSLSLGIAAGTHCSYYDDDAYQAELAWVGSHLQKCHPVMRSASPKPSVVRSLSALQQDSFLPTVMPDIPSLKSRASVPMLEQCSEAAALAKAYAGSTWPTSSPPRSPASCDVFPKSFSSHSSGYSDLCSEELPKSVRTMPAPMPFDSSTERDGSRDEEDSASDKIVKTSGRKKTRIDHITVEYLRDNHCFDMPLAEAAKSLDVGLSVMKRVCRTLGLARWPYRTRSSLRSVIEKTEKYLADRNLDSEEGEACSGQKAHVLEALQSEMNSVTGQGGSDLNPSVRKYRQSIFKLNYKLKKSKMNCKARHKIAVPQNAAERILANQAPDTASP